MDNENVIRNMIDLYLLTSWKPRRQIGKIMS